MIRKPEDLPSLYIRYGPAEKGLRGKRSRIKNGIPNLQKKARVFFGLALAERLTKEIQA